MATGNRQPESLLIVDAANVVGSVPDGWWRDRAAAAERLRDVLVPLAVVGLPTLPPPLEVVLVVEGAARTLTSVPQVRVVAAEGVGDDTVVALVRAVAGPGRRRAGGKPAGGGVPRPSSPFLTGPDRGLIGPVRPAPGAELASGYRSPAGGRWVTLVGQP